MLNQFVPISVRLQDFSAKVLQKDFRLSLAKAGKLFRIWGSAAMVSFLAVMIIHTRFFGRFKVDRNETIYRNHYYVGQAGTVELCTREGYGITSYGENGLVVNKTLDPDAFRVLFIGDSFVKARHVSDHVKFTEIVEHNWNATHPEMPIQTVNLGLSGLDMADHLSFGDNMDNHFRPDLVFLFVGKKDFIPVAELERKIQRLTDPLAAPQTSTRVHLINQMGYYGFFKHLQRQTEGFLRNGSRVFEAGGNNEQPPLVDAEAIAIQLKGLKRIWGERLVIIYYEPILDLGKDAFEMCEDKFLGEMEKQGIPVINLYQPLLEAFQERKPPTGFNNSILGQGHFNQYGHQLIAKEILKFMETTDDLF